MDCEFLNNGGLLNLIWREIIRIAKPFITEKDFTVNAAYVLGVERPTALKTVGSRSRTNDEFIYYFFPFFSYFHLYIIYYEFSNNLYSYT